MKAQGYTKETVRNVGVEERNFPLFDVGDTIAVTQKIKEGSKERLQVFEGDVISFKRNGISTTFTVRRIGAHNVGVEKIYPYHSSVITNIKLVRHARVRRARLYYLRDRVGKRARL